MNHAEDENWYTVYIDIYQYRNEGRSSKKIKSQPTTPLYKKTKNNKKTTTTATTTKQNKKQTKENEDQLPLSVQHKFQCEEKDMLKLTNCDRFIRIIQSDLTSILKQPNIYIWPFSI